MSPSVLIIDPSPTCRLILRTALRRAGIESVAYADGREVFFALRDERDLTPAVVLLEAELPVIDGYSLVVQLKAQARLSRCTFIMLSRRDGVLDRLLGRLAGATDYLTKPFDTKQVVDTVAGYLTAHLSREARATDRLQERGPVPGFPASPPCQYPRMKGRTNP